MTLDHTALVGTQKGNDVERTSLHIESTHSVGITTIFASV